MKTMTLGVVLATVGLALATVGCSTDLEEPEALGQSEAAYTKGAAYAGYSGSTTAVSGDVGGSTGVAPGVAVTCQAPYVVVGDECKLWTSDPKNPGGGGYYVTYNPCMVGYALQCNVFGSCYCILRGS